MERFKQAFDAFQPHQLLYQQQLDRLPGAVRTYTLNTRCGAVSITEAGELDNPPLLALPGLHTPAPFNLEMIWQLTQHFRVISPDLPGHAGLTPGIAPEPQGHAWGAWVVALMDALLLPPACPMVGISFGGAVVLDTAAFAPERVGATSLIVPAGLEHSVVRPLKHFLLPWLKFRLRSSEQDLHGLLQPLLSESWPALEAYYMAVFTQQNPGMPIPPGPVDASALKRWHSPVQIFVARDDAYFDPDALAREAHARIPNVRELLFLDDRHIPDSCNRGLIQQKLVAFLT